MLRKVKKQIENEFTDAVNNHVKELEEMEKEAKPKKIIAKSLQVCFILLIFATGRYYNNLKHVSL